MTARTRNGVRQWRCPACRRWKAVKHFTSRKARCSTCKAKHRGGIKLPSKRLADEYTRDMVGYVPGGWRKP